MTEIPPGGQSERVKHGRRSTAIVLATAWLAGAGLVWALALVCSPGILGRRFVRAALEGESQAEVSARLTFAIRSGIPEPSVLLGLMEHGRLEVRRAAAFGLAVSPDPVTIPELAAFYEDPDPVVRAHCLSAGADRGDRRAALLMRDRLPTADQGSVEHNIIVHGLAAGDFREAGDDCVRRLISASGRLRDDLIYRLQALLVGKGFMDSEGINIGGRRFEASTRSGIISEQEMVEWANALAATWQQHRLQYRSVDAFQEGDSIYPVPRRKNDLDPRLLWPLIAKFETIWTCAFLLGVLLLRWARARSCATG